MTPNQSLSVIRPSAQVRVRYLHALSRQARLAVADSLDVDNRRDRFGADWLDAVERLSGELKAAGAALGFDAPVARRLLSFRELLDSHILTATAIAGCDPDQSAAVEMVFRGVDAVAAGLPDLDDPMLSSSGTTISGD